jgi:hypothetical protein
MTPQNYYKERKVRKLKSVNERLIKQLVQTERAVQPRIGGLKLYHQLKTELEKIWGSSLPLTLVHSGFFNHFYKSKHQLHMSVHQTPCRTAGYGVNSLVRPGKVV